MSDGEAIVSGDPASDIVALPETVAQWLAEAPTLAGMVANIEAVEAAEALGPHQAELDLFEFPNLPTKDAALRKKTFVYNMLRNYRARLFQAGVNPIDMMCRLAMMAFEAGDYDRAFDLWERVAPYMHAKMASVANVPLSGPGGGGKLQVAWMPDGE
jgi:hypothetical protein